MCFCVLRPMHHNEAHLSAQEHGQGLAGAKPIPIAEIVHRVPSQGPILAPFQYQSMEESQDKQQPWPYLGLFRTALGKHCGGQTAETAQKSSFDALQHCTHESDDRSACSGNRRSQPSATKAVVFTVPEDTEGQTSHESCRQNDQPQQVLAPMSRVKLQEK